MTSSSQQSQKPQQPKKSLRPRLTLFWRLFLSLLAMLLITSALSVGIERRLNNQHINNRMQAQVADLLAIRSNIGTYINEGDFEAIRQLYRQDRRFMEQIRILNEQGEILTFRRPINSDNSFTQSSPNHIADNRRQNSHRDEHNIALNQVSISEDSFPELADITVAAPDGQRYTLQVQPRLPLREIMASKGNYTWLRIILTLLFSILACYWFSRTLTYRIKKLQQVVHRISEGNYDHSTELSKLGDDELGRFANEVQQMSERLLESEIARKRMLSDISHELRSPLARLDIATELTRDFAPQANFYLDRIEKESRRMNELIDQIIHIQSLQMNNDQIDIHETESINMLTLLDDIKQDVSFEYHDKQVQWQWALSINKNNPSSYTVTGHRDQLYSAFENVIRNAFEHTIEHSSVNVTLNTATTAHNARVLEVTVCDEGNGIDNVKDLERIFQPFVRLSASRSRKPHGDVSTGYGLGLAITHAIVQAHQGKVVAYNRTDGIKGLAIQITLPLN